MQPVRSFTHRAGSYSSGGCEGGAPGKEGGRFGDSELGCSGLGSSGLGIGGSGLGLNGGELGLGGVEGGDGGRTGGSGGGGGTVASVRPSTRSESSTMENSELLFWFHAELILEINTGLQ